MTTVSTRITSPPDTASVGRLDTCLSRYYSIYKYFYTASCRFHQSCLQQHTGCGLPLAEKDRNDHRHFASDLCTGEAERNRQLYLP